MVKCGTVVLLLALALWQYGCTAQEAPTEAPKAGGTQAERDRSECITFAQTSIARDFAVDPVSRRILTKPRGDTLASYSTEDELSAFNEGLSGYLVRSCLHKRGYRLFFGFSFLPPKGHDWKERSLHTAGDTSVAFGKFASKAPPHQVLAMVRIKELDWPPHGPAYLVRHAAVEDLRREWGQARYTILSFQTSETTWLAADCVRFSITGTDRGVPGFAVAVFTVEVRGLRCVHPDLPMLRPRQVVDISYTQRFLEGQWSEAFDAEVEPFLSSLVFTPVHVMRYIISAFERYATLLRELNRKAEAAEALTRTEKLRESERVGEMQFGFNPSAILREHAALLRGQGREAEARDVDALATAYLRLNFEEYLRRK